jgi:hypothetical protein
MPALVDESIPHFRRDPSVVFGLIGFNASQATLTNNTPHTDQFLSVGLKKKFFDFFYIYFIELRKLFGNILYGIIERQAVA